QAPAAAHAQAPVGVVVRIGAVEHAAPDAGIQAEVVRQSPACATGHVQGIGVGATEVIAVGGGQAVGFDEGGGGDQLVEVQARRTRIGVAVEHDVEVDRITQVGVVAHEVVDFQVRIAGAEVHARSPHAGIDADRRRPGQASLGGGFFVGLRHAAP